MLGKVLLAIFVSVVVLPLFPLNHSQAQPLTENAKKPIITKVRLVSLPTPTDETVKFILAIDGENLPEVTGQQVRLETKDPASPVTDISLGAPSDKEILVNGNAAIGTEITRIVLYEGTEPVADTTEDWTVSLKPTVAKAGTPQPGKLKQFTIELDHQKNKEFPNLHSLVITKNGGDAEAGFDANPHRMTVDLVPTGATELNVVQSNNQQLDLHFVAAADYEPKGVVVTVYDSSDLDKRVPLYVATEKKQPDENTEKKPSDEDSAQPKITGTEVVFVDRPNGNGRIRIYGSGFGDYKKPRYSVDEYLGYCLKKFDAWLADETDYEKYKDLRLRTAQAKVDACARFLHAKTHVLDENDLKQLSSTLNADPVSYLELAPNEWQDWEAQIRERVAVGVNGRNQDISVERVEVLNINDKMIDVYFEFTRDPEYAIPFRLGDSTVTIMKPFSTSSQTVKNEKVIGTVTGKELRTYALSYQPGAKHDSNLTYRYSVLDKKSANTLVGKGIADNFFVLQLSVINNGEKKVAIPLSGIQAEVEWTVFEDPTHHVEYLSGPATLPPIPLSAVSGYFDAYQKVKGTRAILFNVLDAATVVATGLVPFTGPSFKDASLFYSGAAVPGARKAWGDLSGQQLQNLTSLSWESSETLPAKGGATERLIYIMKREQDVGKAGNKNFKRQVSDIRDVEITGFEVTESEPKQAAPAAGATPPAPATPKSTIPNPSPQNPSPPATTTPPATPSAQPNNNTKKPKKLK